MRGAAAAATSLAVVLLVPATAEARILLAGFTTDLPGSEFDDAVWLTNPGTEAVNLSDVSISDGEGALAFPPDAVIGAGSTLAVAVDAGVFREAAGVDPDFALFGLPGPRTLRLEDDGFRLGQEGDEVELRRGPQTLDAVRYGTSSREVPGWTGEPVSVRGGTFLRSWPRIGSNDTDAASDWDVLRRHLLGQDLFAPTRTHVAGEILAYTAPERSREMVEAAIDLAQGRLRINVYEFRDLALARHLAEVMMARPGLAVDVLLDASPVGQDRRERDDADHVIQTLRDAGAKVHALAHARYGFDHAKYVVADDRYALVQSENFVPSGIPVDRTSGNRGWGVLIDDAAFAGALAQVFDADFRVRAYGASEPEGEPTTPPPVLPARWTPAATRPVAHAEGANVTLLVAPLDPTKNPILDALANATTSVEMELLDLPMEWRTPTGSMRPNALVEAAREAARRGVQVRILLDGHFLDAEDHNGDTVDALLALGEANLTARLSPYGSVLHVKGLIVDRKTVLVGSINWNLASVAQNREVDVLVEDAGLAVFFAEAFEQDWTAALGIPAPTPGPSLVGTLMTLTYLAVGTIRRRHRR